MTLESTTTGITATRPPGAAITRDAHSDGEGDSDSAGTSDGNSTSNGNSTSDSSTTSDSHDEDDTKRAIAPIGTILLVAIAVILAAGVGAATFGGAPLQEPAPTASLSLSADGDELTIRHLAGDSLETEDLRLEVTVDGDPLAHQPPVPFFSATGFRPGPTGAFNVAGDTTLSPGETASLRIAGTNSPLPSPGDRVEVSVYSEGYRIARLTAHVR
ncbi:MAG: type IV pilin [Halopenitus sp.]